MIQIYKYDNTNYSNNGDVTLNPTSCIYKDSEKELILEHSYDESSRWKYIECDNVIKGTLHGIDQLFRIYKIENDLDTITAYARPIMYDLINNVLIDVRPTTKTGQEALDIILNGTGFTGHSDIPKINTAYYVRKNIIEALFSDDDNSFINRWGGELYFENFNIYLMSKIGNDDGIRIDEGYNLEDIKGTINFDEVTTRIVPTGFNGITLDGEYPFVDSSLINNYSNVLMKVINFEDVKVKENEDEEGFNTLAEAQTELQARCRELYSSGIDKPKISYEIAVTNDERLRNVSTGDFVHVYVKKLDLYVATRVSDYEFDLLEQRNISVSVGNVEKTYEQKQGDVQSAVNNAFNQNGNIKGGSIEGVINAMQTQFKALKDSAQKQDIRAMLFEDRVPTSPTFGA